MGSLLVGLVQLWWMFELNLLRFREICKEMLHFLGLVFPGLIFPWALLWHSCSWLGASGSSGVAAPSCCSIRGSVRQSGSFECFSACKLLLGALVLFWFAKLAFGVFGSVGLGLCLLSWL